MWVLSSDYSQDLSLGPNILKQTGDLYRRFRNTLRYMLGALDGMTQDERLPAQEMPELERWVLNRLAEVDASVREDIAAYDIIICCKRCIISAPWICPRFILMCARTASTLRQKGRKSAAAPCTVIETIFDHLVVLARTYSLLYGGRGLSRPSWRTGAEHSFKNISARSRRLA